jgi:hypothetical protein
MSTKNNHNFLRFFVVIPSNSRKARLYKKIPFLDVTRLRAKKEPNTKLRKKTFATVVNR